jgi:hypothetical protein
VKEKVEEEAEAEAEAEAEHRSLLINRACFETFEKYILVLCFNPASGKSAPNSEKLVKKRDRFRCRNFIDIC